MLKYKYNKIQWRIQELLVGVLSMASMEGPKVPSEAREATYCPTYCQTFTSDRFPICYIMTLAAGKQ